MAGSFYNRKKGWGYHLCHCYYCCCYQKLVNSALKLLSPQNNKGDNGDSECICKPKGNIAILQRLGFKKRGPALTVGIRAIPGAGLGVLLEDYEGQRALYGNGSARVRRTLLKGGPFLSRGLIELFGGEMTGERVREGKGSVR